jgi:ubiquinol-cytochrome c reductase iron-sulfur subunit
VDREPGVSSDERRHAHLRIGACLIVATGGLAGLLVTLLADGNHQLQGVFAAVASGGAGTALVVGAHRLFATGEAEEERHPSGPGVEKAAPSRPVRRGLLVAGAATFVAAVVAPWAALGSRAERALRGTAWTPGSLVVDSEGRPVTVDTLIVGGLLTVWPEGAVGNDDAQTVLVRVAPERMVARAERQDWSPEGYVAYSKLCTHMGCPVGLYQEDPGLLLCPCHQAAFDVLDGARPVHGPALRPLPQLPLAVGADGVLRAQGDFPEAVGPGWWSRPT